MNFTKGNIDLGHFLVHKILGSRPPPTSPLAHHAWKTPGSDCQFRPDHSRWGSSTGLQPPEFDRREFRSSSRLLYDLRVGGGILGVGSLQTPCPLPPGGSAGQRLSSGLMLILQRPLPPSAVCPGPPSRCRQPPDCTTLHYTTLHYTTLHYTTLHYTTLHYTTLHYTTLHYTTLHYTTLHYTTLHYTTLHYTTLHCATLHYTTLHYTTLHYTTLHYTTLHYTTLHYTTPRHAMTRHDTTRHYTTSHYKDIRDSRHTNKCSFQISLDCSRQVGRRW